MCGIAGIVSLQNRPVKEGSTRVRAMLSLMRHRGPDRSGFFASKDGRVMLGNTRLSIVDVVNDFSIPLQSISRNCVVTYNGEIFNYIQERNRLIAKGVDFTTASDTEVLLMGLHEEGVEFLNRLNGFWGFAYFDQNSGKLTISRDLLGEKHVFFAQNEQELVFASEAQAVFSILGSRPKVDHYSIINGFQYRVAAPGKTLFSGISRLQAGMGLEIDLGKSRPAVRSVRHLKLKPEKWFGFFGNEPKEEDVIGLFSEKISQACAMRLPQEVDFYTTLSGGLDSTLINVYSKKNGFGSVKSLFGRSTEASPQRGDDLSEQAASEFSSKRIGTQHNVFSMMEDDCIPIYNHHARTAFDGLLCEGAACYQQLAQQVAQKGGRVLIVSDGPDELIGGYDMDASAYRMHKYATEHPSSSSFLQLMTGNVWFRGMSLNDRHKHMANWECLSNQPFKFRPIHGGTSSEVMSDLFKDGYSDATAGGFGTIPAEYDDILQRLDISQKMALSYACYSIPDYFNLRSDRGSMQESVELRLPFLDPELVELMIATPSEWRFHGGEWSKFVLRKIVEQTVGPKIAYRGKYGFAYPAWYIPRLAEKLEIDGRLEAFDSWESLGFKSTAKSVLQRPEEGRLRWFALCIADTLRQTQTS